ncbi:Ribonuclease HII (RNase HII) [Alteracholeplasma palmae J233]|uniref:Ribonuclease HII n=1 Tax=Alteracholeplasma palmae (strain ATCC 49389 / J233) TaxID=1318466 RepID=U4KK61_ALTPJ|nr:ribonuclease HII [Alteracholeplasma palmae]CCV64049.1 Ribonuclease HII (RNase HII) [Alteracholeplasma palmae J233]
MIPTTNLYLYENEYHNLGYIYIAGTDEAGRGPLAGPVVASAVILKKDAILPLVYDSKKLTEKMRLKALEQIKENALAIETVFIDPEKIDEINIYQASKLAMIQAIEKLDPKPNFILTDAMPIGDEYEHLSIIKGDQKSISIAAASIVAKVTRDEYMEKMAIKYPEYGFETHKGYGTKKHIEAIKKYGITPIHRKTYEPIKTLIKK